jgi:hypothetical protein
MHINHPAIPTAYKFFFMCRIHSAIQKEHNFRFKATIYPAQNFQCCAQQLSNQPTAYNFFLSSNHNADLQKATFNRLQNPIHRTANNFLYLVPIQSSNSTQLSMHSNRPANQQQTTFYRQQPPSQPTVYNFM